MDEKLQINSKPKLTTKKSFAEQLLKIISYEQPTCKENKNCCKIMMCSKNMNHRSHIKEIIGIVFKPQLFVKCGIFCVSQNQKIQVLKYMLFLFQNTKIAQLQILNYTSCKHKRFHGKIKMSICIFFSSN